MTLAVTKKLSDLVSLLFNFEDQILDFFFVMRLFFLSNIYEKVAKPFFWEFFFVLLEMLFIDCFFS